MIDMDLIYVCFKSSSCNFALHLGVQGEYKYLHKTENGIQSENWTSNTVLASVWLGLMLSTALVTQIQGQM